MSSSSSDGRAGFRFKATRKEEYSIYRSRLSAKLKGKGLWEVCSNVDQEKRDVEAAEQQSNTGSLSENESKKMRMRDKAVQIISASLGDVPFRVVDPAIGRPAEMLRLLDERYASTRAVSRISVMTSLYRTRFSGGSIVRHCDKIASLLSQLDKMGSDVALPDAHKGVLLLSSIGVETEYEATAAALRTKDPKELTFDLVSTTLIDEETSRHANSQSHGTSRGNYHHRESRTAASSSTSVGNQRSKIICDYCKHVGHKAADCFVNPSNPNNRLPDEMKKKLAMVSEKAADGNKDKSSKPRGKKKSGKKKITVAGVATIEREASHDVSPDNSEIYETCLAAHEKLHQENFRETLIDSGASAHIFGSNELVHNKRNDRNMTIDTADGTTAPSTTVGTVHVNFPDASLILQKTLYSPQMKYNLVSVGTLTDKGLFLIFRGQFCFIHKDDADQTLLATIKKHPETKLYHIPKHLMEPVITATVTTDVTIWHHRAGHPGPARLCSLHKHVDDIPVLSEKNLGVCDACELAKATKLPFRGKMEDASFIGQIVYSDVTGPFRTSYDGFRYCITFTDSFSRYLWIINAPTKEVKNYFPAYLRAFNSYGHGKKLIRLHTDGGGEYKPLSAKYPAISFTPTAPYTPEHNPIAERINRSLKDPARALLIAANLPGNFWSFAMEHITRLYNQMPHSHIGTTPTKKLTKKRPSAKNWHPFGCKAFVHVPKQNQRGFEPRAEVGILLSCLSHGLFRVLPSSGKIIESRNVRFEENKFPGIEFLRQNRLLSEDEEDSFDFDYDESDSQSSSITNVCSNSLETDSDSSEYSDVDVTTESSLQSSEGESTSSSDDEEEYETVTDCEVEDTRLNLEAITHIPVVESTHGEQEEASPKRQNPRPRREHRVPDRYIAGVVITTSDKPTISEALSSTPQEIALWKESLVNELESLVETGTIGTVESLPPDAVILPSFAILQVKRLGDGAVERLRSRIVGGGHKQTKKTYRFKSAPVVDFAVVRMFIVICVKKRFKVVQVDVICAFLNGELDELLHIRLPNILPAPYGGAIYRLWKAIYGLKQAHHQWHKKLVKDLERNGFVELPSAPCFFRKKTISGDIYLLVYVDDILIAAGAQSDIDATVQILRELYGIREMGTPEWFLGINLEWKSDKNGNFLEMSQRQAIKQFLEDNKVTMGKPVRSPMISDFYRYLASEADVEIVNQTRYQEIIGSLLYFACKTRPDILTAVSILSRFTHKPTAYCWVALRRIMQYLHTTSSTIMEFRGTEELKLHAYSDSDYAADFAGRKSMSGGAIFLGSSMIHYHSRKQDCTALSTGEAEYIAVSEVAKDLKWFVQIMRQLGMDSSEPISVYCDNNPAITWTEPLSTKLPKHIDVRYNFVRDLVEDKTIEVVYIPSAKNVADIFTKPLPIDAHRNHCESIGIKVWEEC